MRMTIHHRVVFLLKVREDDFNFASPTARMSTTAFTLLPALTILKTWSSSSRTLLATHCTSPLVSGVWEDRWYVELIVVATYFLLLFRYRSQVDSSPFAVKQDVNICIVGKWKKVPLIVQWGVPINIDSHWMSFQARDIYQHIISHYVPTQEVSDVSELA